MRLQVVCAAGKTILSPLEYCNGKPVKSNPITLPFCLSPYYWTDDIAFFSSSNVSKMFIIWFAWNMVV